MSDLIDLDVQGDVSEERELRFTIGGTGWGPDGENDFVGRYPTEDDVLLFMSAMTGTASQIAATRELFEAVLEPSSYTALIARIRDPRDPLHFTHLADFITSLTKEALGAPLDERSGSTQSRGSTGRRSTGSSSRRASTPASSRRAASSTSSTSGA
jgi:hypothetical protein